MPYEVEFWCDLALEVVGTATVEDFNLALQMVEFSLERFAKKHTPLEHVYYEVVNPAGKCYTYTLVNGEWQVSQGMRLGYGQVVQTYEAATGGSARGNFQKVTGYGYQVRVTWREPITSAQELVDLFPNLLGLNDLD